MYAFIPQTLSASPYGGFSIEGRLRGARDDNRIPNEHDNISLLGPYPYKEVPLWQFLDRVAKERGEWEEVTTTLDHNNIDVSHLRFEYDERGGLAAVVILDKSDIGGGLCLELAEGANEVCSWKWV